VRVGTLRKKNGENMEMETKKDGKNNVEEKLKMKLSLCSSVLKHNDTKEYDELEAYEQLHAMLNSTVNGGE
jgi:hypothetical protein